MAIDGLLCGTKQPFATWQQDIQTRSYVMTTMGLRWCHCSRNMVSARQIQCLRFVDWAAIELTAEVARHLVSLAANPID